MKKKYMEDKNATLPPKTNKNDEAMDMRYEKINPSLIIYLAYISSRSKNVKAFIKNNSKKLNTKRVCVCVC